MDFDQFVALSDSNKTFLVEINTGEEMHDYTWTQHGLFTNLYFTPYARTPNMIEEDGVKYVERFTFSAANSQAGSFYYDQHAQILYIHDVNSDDPGSMSGTTYDYYILTYVWQYFTNAQYQDYPVVFARQQECLTDGSFEAWTSSTNLDSYTESLTGSSTITRESTEIYDGAYSVKITIDGSGNAAYILQDIILLPNGKARIRVRYKNSTSGKTADLVLRNSGFNVYLTSTGSWATSWATITLPNSITWTQYEIEFNVHEGYTDYEIHFRGDSSAISSDIYFDKAELIMYREDNYYLPYLQSANTPAVHQAVSDYYKGSMKMQFGRLKFLNDGSWYQIIDELVWHRKTFRLLYGGKTDNYEDFSLVYTGKTRKPEVNDTYATFTISDFKVLIYKEVPKYKFWITNYPNLEEGYEGISIPVVYGEVEGIVPVCVDIATYKYKISDHELEDILYVYKDEVALTITTDYTIDLANGEFTLVVDPVDAVISCDVQGKKCDMVDGTYSTNVADILWDLLVVEAGISKLDLDKASFLDLKGGRTQDHHLYIGVDDSVRELTRVLQQSSLFHLIPLANGQMGVYRYKTGTTSDTPRIVDQDYSGFNLVRDTAGIYKKVKVKYNRKPGDDTYSVITRENEITGYKYQEEDTYTITTTLVDSTDAGNLADYYIDLFGHPQRKVTATIPTIAFPLRPAEKVVLNKTRVDMNCNETITVLDEEPYRVLELKKDLKSGKVTIVALEDLQSAGATFCEVCYYCQTCDTVQFGSCSTCYFCEHCDSDECTNCQWCDVCQNCDVDETCVICEVCYGCEKCDAGECSSCELCYACEDCDSGECTNCQVCNNCMKCDACESGECTICETCDECMICNVVCEASECATCYVCEKCDGCEESECTTCMLCVGCENCDTCENSQCTTCEICVGCQKCDSGECTTCMDCDACQVCDACENSQCTTCEACNVCQKCDSGECTSCESCVACQKCDTGECTTCMNCNDCQLCNFCDACYYCEHCNTCEVCDGEVPL